MQEFHTQFRVHHKSEDTDGDEALQFTIVLVPIGPNVSEQITLTNIDPEINELFTSNEVFDAVFTPHIEPE